jgi:hypothetical protein
VATDAARLIPALLGEPFEDLQCFTTLSGRYRHRYGCLNHVFLHFVNLMAGSRASSDEETLHALVENLRLSSPARTWLAMYVPRTNRGTAILSTCCF